MNVKPKYYFDVENDYVITHNKCYSFIMEEFDSEEEAIEALNKLGEMFESSFKNWNLDFGLELKKKYVYKNCWGST